VHAGEHGAVALAAVQHHEVEVAQGVGAQVGIPVGTRAGRAHRPPLGTRRHRHRRTVRAGNHPGAEQRRRRAHVATRTRTDGHGGGQRKRSRARPSCPHRTSSGQGSR
jgi:hypothetical protein